MTTLPHPQTKDPSKDHIEPEVDWNAIDYIADHPYIYKGNPVTLEEYQQIFPKFDPFTPLIDQLNNSPVPTKSRYYRVGDTTYTNDPIYWKKLSNKEYLKLKKEMK